MKKLFFRTEASASIGTGHLRRCLTLAKKLRSFYPEICFLVSSETLDLFPDLSSDFKSLVLPVFSDQEVEAQYLLDNLIDFASSIVIVDSYQLDFRWEKLIASNGNYLVVVDDLNRKHCANLIIDQNYRSDYKNWYLDNLISGQRLLGTNYCLLSEDYLPQLRIGEYLARPSQILVSYGGGDFGQLVKATVNAFANASFNDWQLNFVVGNRLSIDEEIKKFILNAKFRYHSVLASLSPLLSNSQIAVGAGGTSHWERFFYGVPSIIFTIAENQRQINQDLADAGCIIYLGEPSASNLNRLPQVVHSLINNPENRRELHQKCALMVDGRGTKRVVSHILSSNLSLRKAKEADSKMLFAWRNHPEIRKFSLGPRELNFSDHERWLGEILKSKTNDLMIVEIDQQPLGVLRFDYQEEDAKISIHLDPSRHNQGWGLSLLFKAEQYLLKQEGISSVTAIILNQNKRSQIMFADAGYKFYSSENDFQIWKLNLNNRL